MAQPVDPELSKMLIAWGIALATTLQAVSTWYLSRKTTKSVAKSDEATKGVVNDASSLLEKRLKALEKKVDPLPGMVEEARNSQVTVFEKHAETMNEVLKTLKTMQAVTRPQSPTSSEPTKLEAKDDKKPPLGKVIVKP